MFSKPGTGHKRWNEACESGRDLTLTKFAKYSSVDPDTIRTLCPELLPHLCKPGEWIQRKIDAAFTLAFSEIEKSGEVKTVKEFATSAGISAGTLSESYHHWVVRLNEHNNSMREAKLQEVWSRMECSGTVWSFEKFAKEAGICTQTLTKCYPNWRDRLKAEVARRDHEVMRRLEQVLEEARKSRIFMTPRVVAKEAGIGYKMLRRHYTSVYNRILAYIEITFRPKVEGMLREIIDSGECPTPAEFSQRCGFRHSSALQEYFPDVAEQLRTLDK